MLDDFEGLVLVEVDAGPVPDRARRLGGEEVGGRLRDRRVDALDAGLENKQDVEINDKEKKIKCLNFLLYELTLAKRETCFCRAIRDLSLSLMTSTVFPMLVWATSTLTSTSSSSSDAAGKSSPPNC